MQCIVDGLMTKYSKSGEGPLVVVLHGWGASSENLSLLSAVLAPNHTVISIDLPGFGGTSRPPEPWGVGEYAQFVRSVLQKLGYNKPSAMIGHSFGGRICIKAVGEGMLSPDKLVLIGSAGVKHSGSLRNQVYKLIAKTGKLVLSLPGLSRLSASARRKLYEHTSSSDYLTAGEMRPIFSRVIAEDLRPMARKIPTVTLLIWGEYDDQAPLADARILHECILGSKLEVVRGAGHFVHTDNPELVNRLVKEFLDA